MSQTYFKAIREDGFDFATKTIDYGKAAKSRSKKVTHPRPKIGSPDASQYLSVARVSTDCTGFIWPARLLQVEPTGDSWTPHASSMPNKVAVTELKIIRELPAWQLFGPEGEHIVVIIDQFAALDRKSKEDLASEMSAYWSIWWPTYNSVAGDGRAVRAGLDAARRALYVRLGGWRGGRAAYGAALTLLCRPLVGSAFTQAEYDILSRPWRKVIGEIHPDDEAVK